MTRDISNIQYITSNYGIWKAYMMTNWSAISPNVYMMSLLLYSFCWLYVWNEKKKDYLCRGMSELQYLCSYHVCTYVYTICLYVCFLMVFQSIQYTFFLSLTYFSFSYINSQVFWMTEKNIILLYLGEKYVEKVCVCCW